MEWSMPGLPVHHQLLELVQTHVHRVGDAIQPSHPPLSLSPSALYLFPHQPEGLSQWVSCLHQMAELLGFQLHNQSFQWIFRVYFLLDWLVWSPSRPRDSQGNVYWLEIIMCQGQRPLITPSMVLGTQKLSKRLWTGSGRDWCLV